MLIICKLDHTEKVYECPSTKLHACRSCNVFKYHENNWRLYFFDFVLFVRLFYLVSFSLRRLQSLKLTTLFKRRRASIANDFCLLITIYSNIKHNEDNCSHNYACFRNRKYISKENNKKRCYDLIHIHS